MAENTKIEWATHTCAQQVRKERRPMDSRLAARLDAIANLPPVYVIECESLLTGYTAYADGIGGNNTLNIAQPYPTAKDAEAALPHDHWAGIRYRVVTAQDAASKGARFGWELITKAQKMFQLTLSRATNNTKEN